MTVTNCWPLRLFAVGLGLAVVAIIPTRRLDSADKTPAADSARDYPNTVVPLLKQYCLTCHSTKLKKGSLDLERFLTADDLRKDLKPWTGVIEQLEVGEMPPKGKPQPTADQRKQLVAWVRGFLDTEARSRAGDPGHVPLRRLSNAEYDATVRDLTGVDLRPAREFPVDGAAGEGFTNAAEGLAEMSPTLLNKYLTAAKDLADHAVLLPDGIRFSMGKTRRDWTDEGTAALRQFYAEHATGDGTLPVQPYLLATVRQRLALAAGRYDEVAVKEKLNARYLRMLWETLTDRKPSQPLDAIRAKWQAAAEKDVPALAEEVAAWQNALWRTVKVGNYVQASWNSASGYTESLTRQVPVDPPAATAVPLRVSVKPAPGQSEVVVYLAARETGKAGPVVWGRPRFEGPGKSALSLRDYSNYGPAFEADHPTAFAGTAKYLAAVVTLATDPKANAADLAKQHGLDPAFLKQWAKVLAVPPSQAAEVATRPAVELTLLDDKTPPNVEHKFIGGWKKKGTDLPVFLANASGQTEMIPGRVSGYGVAMHPMPDEFVAVVWKSPVAGQVKVTVRVAHAHPACGNGVAWFLEHRHSDRATLLAEGAVDLGKEAKPPVKQVTVEKGDTIVLAVDARDGNHVCDMTEVGLNIVEVEKPGRSWDLAGDVWSNVQASNPHADKHGNSDTWSFVRGPSKGRTSAAAAPGIPADSVLGRWRLAATDVTRQLATAMLAKEAEKLLTGPRPADEKNPDRAVYDHLVTADGPLFEGLDVTRLAKPRPKGGTFGLPRERFGTGDSLATAADAVVEMRLPVALFVGRDFVVDARLDGQAGDRLVRVQAATTPPGPRWDGLVLAAATGAGFRELTRGHADFRRVFPLYTCFPIVVPTDEVVTLKMFHREDDALVRMFLDAEQVRRLDRLWAEQRFISRQPAAEYAYLPQFMGFTTQDTPKEFQQFFIDRKPLFKKRAEEFEQEVTAAIPKQLDALIAFVSRACRRPLTDTERGNLLGLYDGLRKKGVTHEEAFRGVLARVFVAPSFLFHVEQAPPGREPKPVTDQELASRLSYFLWSSMPDAELRRLAGDGKLRDPNVLTAQVGRMLDDLRVRNLAIEFGTQWIHVRGFEDLKEKNERLFPTFDANLRKAIAEESILFFQDLFQANRPVTTILDADYTYLNETLAKHYGIPRVSGPEWRRVDGVHKFGRGGVLGLASVQTKEAGASRTSPVLRGNWVVETLLGEKLPKPPPNVPRLPEEETGNAGLTMRQLTERHTKEESCANCHVRIDPYGFAFEKYDPIGRFRDKDAGGLPVDAKSKLKDGTEFEGIDGLRGYLLAKKKDVIVRLFCKRLLGYALGRAVALSDQTLVDEMTAELAKNDGRVQAAVLAIVRSPQFRMIRGSEQEN
jgi:Protein of unknown function (DUF1592)/Protein of unknown function (DUF1588)/Protein of unknown function (DUF1587)/Protein of unknown function (DUF1585)/Protein of unknown function (DUF1595)/Cytochrome C oxidase, cbb3-type, subunit III